MKYLLEHPKHGRKEDARYHLRWGEDLVGWTNDKSEADDWLRGFGPVTTARIVDRLYALPARRR